MVLLRTILPRGLPPPARQHLYLSKRFYSTPQQPRYEPPTPPSTASNPHREFYQSWGVPVAKVFLGALFTYQIIHYSWLKLEELELKQQKEEDIKILEGRLAEVTDRTKANS